ncbi:MAG: hypothetical protein QOF76_247 [Solirubrobacteraceae bacterium]|jgi:DNA-binding NarL/FixJ family response regulator|nr:hypothetical protein [Solirubrobacteraceae bacterium]
MSIVPFPSSPRMEAAARLSHLSAREREVLGLMAEGHSNRAISDMLFLSRKTVEAHVGSIFRRLELPENDHCHRRVLAVLTYREARGLSRAA